MNFPIVKNQRIWRRHFLGAITTMLAAAFLINANAQDGIYLDPGGGTFQKDQEVSIQASEAPAYISPNGEKCCGGGQDGFYEFYDIEYTDWYGDVANPCGNGAFLDTSSPGDKSVTCNGLMRFRCSGGGDIAGPVSVSGTGYYTVTNNIEPLGGSIDPSDLYVFVNNSQAFTCDAFGGEGPYSYRWECSGGTPSVQDGSSNVFTPMFSSTGNFGVLATITDSKGRKKSVQTTVKVVKIKSYTDKLPRPRNRQVLGVCEEAIVWVVDDTDNKIANVQWNISEGAQSTVTADGEVTASSVAETFSVIATIGTNQEEYAFQVIPPNDFEVSRLNPTAVKGTQYSLAFMEIDIYLLPKTVCFGNLEVIETPGMDNESPIHETSRVPAAVNDVNYLSVTDKVGAYRDWFEYETSEWTWVCDWSYMVDGSSEQFLIKQLDQIFTLGVEEIDASTRVEKIKIQKFGLSIDNYNEPVTTAAPGAISSQIKQQ